MADSNQRYGGSALIVFLLFPFIGFIRACGRLRAPMCGVIFVLFYGLFGYCHTFEDSRTDAFRIASEFVSSYLPNWHSVLVQYQDGLQPDLFKVGLFGLVGMFTHSPHIYFGLVGIFGGFFAWLTIRRILKDYRGATSVIYFIMVYLLVMKFSPINIGGVRFFAGMGLASYATIKVLLDKKWRWMIAFVFIPLIHFSMIAWVPIILIAAFVKLPRKFLFYMAVFCCVFGTAMNGSSYQQSIRNIVSSVGVENATIRAKASYYTSDEAAEYFDKSLTTHIMRAVSYVDALWFLFALFALRHRLAKVPVDIYTDKLWRFTMLFSSFGYLMTGLSVVGARYQLLGIVFIYALLLRLLSYDNKLVRRTAKRIIVLKFFVSTVGLAQTVYNCYCLTAPELYFAPLPFVIASVL